MLPQAIPVKTLVIVNSVDARSHKHMVSSVVSSSATASDSKCDVRRSPKKGVLENSADLKRKRQEIRRRSVLLGGHIPQTTRVTATGLGPLIGYNLCNSVK